MMKKLPVGVDGFEKIRTQGFYYVDKSMFITREHIVRSNPVLKGSKS